MCTDWSEYVEATTREINQLRADLAKAKADLTQAQEDNAELRAVINRQDHRAASAIAELSDDWPSIDRGAVQRAIRTLKEKVTVRKLAEAMRENALAHTG